jgi:hypothetical protein
MTRIPLATWVAALAALTGCQASGRNGIGVAAVGGGAVSGEVVSTVNGERIGSAEVERLTSAGDLTPAAALARLEAERLLAEEAVRRGYAEQRETAQVARQALVQALLERDVEPQAVDETEIAAAYEKQHARFETPEKRSATHLLAFLPKGASAEQDRAARSFCESASRQLMAASDRAAMLSQLQAFKSPLFAVRLEQLPLVAADGSFVPEFEHALFSLRTPGVVPTPVKTPFGWHVLIVTAIEPATRVPLSAARRDLQRELAVNKRKQAVDALLATLERRSNVSYSEKVQQALAALEL